MTPEQQRIKIAEACGWFYIDKCWHFPNGAKATADGGPSDVPNYPADLNAMHEAEKVLTDNQLDEMAGHLGASEDEFVWKTWRVLLRATAAQRAEAFLKTLGLWEETK